jgi:hypothetical protein
MRDYIQYQVRVYPNGTKEWYLNGKLHREDGPAVEYSDGTKYWYLNGKLHREDGPAIESSKRVNFIGRWTCHKAKSWYLNDKKLTGRINFIVKMVNIPAIEDGSANLQMEINIGI